MEPSQAFVDEMLATEPSLRAFAISLSGNVDRASDLVQETMVRALANHTSFTPGSNMPAWLFTILRNYFRSQYRKHRREVEDGEGAHAATLISQPNQVAKATLDDLKAMLDRLPPDQREAVILVGASGFSYEEAAKIAGCAVGTIKSRVHRARERLAGWLDVEGDETLGSVSQVLPVEFSATRANGSAHHSKKNGAPTRTALPLVPREPPLFVAHLRFAFSHHERLADGTVARVYTRPAPKTHAPHSS